MAQHRPSFICFGEILWDFLPAGLFPGGAPFNVAYHLNQYEADVKIISAVGRDKLGDELLRRIKGWGLDTETIAVHPGLPTGYVLARIADNGDATYEIISSVAWDQIPTDHDALSAAIQADGIIFGSLAQRSPFNQAAFERLIATLPDKAWRIFDANLRPPFVDLKRVRELAGKATLLKLNASEAALIAANEPETPGAEETHARTIAEQTGCEIICVTAGKRGAGLLHHNTWYWEQSKPVKVFDTIGAGDAFLGALSATLVAGNLPIPDCLAQACRLGEWVASQVGGTPPYPPKQDLSS